ncbi:hypothetical protein F8M41_009948 [Gigaspora margarita]|uniref:Uncharacterized protein n=1 Tax=Gigaspora margarita TaxID=4874 RepID=A0A8H4B445_GIGMA|nr:hypothetical protein F8M41_009948 [Gigaspora margarita]
MSFLLKKQKKKQYNYQQGIPTLPRTSTPTTPVLPLVPYQRPNLPRTPYQQRIDNQLQQRLQQHYSPPNLSPTPQPPQKPKHLRGKKLY